MWHEYGMARSGLYRSRDGMLCGVCKGIAEYFDLSVFWLRVIAVVAGFSTGIVPSLVAYVLAALLMKREPW